MTGESLAVNSASRAVAIIEFLAVRPGQTFTLSEIARRVGLNKSTAHTLIHTLHTAEWLFCSPRDMRYGLGPRLTMIGNAAEECVPELVVARPVMDEIAAELKAECVFSAVVKDEIVILGSTGPARLDEATLHVGSRMPCTPPLGTVFLAWFSEAERAQRLRQGLDQGYESMASELAEIRARGYVATLKFSEENRLNRVLEEIPDSYFNRTELRQALEARISAMSTTGYLASYHPEAARQDVDTLQAPVFLDGSPRFAITVSHLDRWLTIEEIDRLGQQVRGAADDISVSISGLGQSVRSAV